MLYRLLHHLVGDELTGSSHARIRHWHGHSHLCVHATETLAHACWEVSVLGIGGGFFEGTKVVFAFIVFFFARVAAVWTFRAITAVVGTTMSEKRMLVSCG
ncbi:hypothetical protein DL95DRAFT_195148 [Leptodontidium sp. 2 PMI_412]|nr:hypothetical protein DL95DRAFT_195148 [Leptodontidium sp. 2 PMI_412]